MSTELVGSINMNKERQKLLNEISCLQEDLRDLDKERSKITALLRDWEVYCKNLKDYHSQQIEQESKKHKSEVENLRTQLELEQKKYKSHHATTSTQIQNLQQQKEDCQSHIKTMSQIISKLSSRGLPEHRDDRYFMTRLDDLVGSISQWARQFSRLQPPLTTKDVRTMKVSIPVRGYIGSSFLDIWSLLNAKNVGGKARTRFVEVIMLRTLMGDRLWKQHIGFLGSSYDSHRNLIKGMSCTGKSYYFELLSTAHFRILEEETQAWSALTIHNLTKNNKNLRTVMEKDIDAITDMLLSDLSPFCDFTKSTLDTRVPLREIVSDVAELGLEIAKLPFEIWPISNLEPGGPFKADMMEDVDPEEEEAIPERTTIIISFPWVKVTYDETGRRVYQPTYLSKARVSCIC